jgi:hypothetical protein
MMCLGWNTQSNCSARPAVDVSTGNYITTSVGPGAASSGENPVCGKSFWFWLAVAGITAAGLLKNREGRK